MKKLEPGISIYGVDKKPERCEKVKAEYDVVTFSSIDEAAEGKQIDCGFVCTSPLSHAAIIRELSKRNINVFTEINLVDDGYEEFADEKRVRLFLSSTFLYRKDIQCMISEVKKQDRVNYIYHTGQYLPDWHPWENYKDFFVGDRRTNGCREIMAIEFPWLVRCFGDIEKISVSKDKMTGLNIDYPDNYLLKTEHAGGSKGIIAIDVVARHAIRRMEIYNEDMHLFWEGTPDSLSRWDQNDGSMEKINTYDAVEHDERYSGNIIENAYMDEIDAFFTWLKGDDSKVLYDFEKDKKILAYIDEIEGAL